MVAQRDTWPGRGMYPTTLWQPGEVIADSLYLHVPDGAYAPNNATLRVGLYEQDGPRLKAIDAQGQVVADNAAPIGSLQIDPRPGEYPNSMQVNFGNQVELLGYEMSPRSILPGEAITVTLFWRATAPFAEDYSVFLNALRPNSTHQRAGYQQAAARYALDEELAGGASDHRCARAAISAHGQTGRTRCGGWLVSAESRPLECAGGRWSRSG